MLDMYNNGYCEICGKFSDMHIFELTSYENSNGLTGTNNNQYYTPKHKTICVCNKCYVGLQNIRFPLIGSNQTSNYSF